VFPPTLRPFRRAFFAAVALVPLAACLACGSDEATQGSGDRDPEGFPVVGDHEPTCGGYRARLEACGLLSQGPFACYEPTSEANRCEFECVTGSSCPILWSLHCGEVPGVLQSCLSLCRTFVCDEGSALPDSWQCDGELDCLDGSDEFDCETFECRSGEVLVARARCNLEADCLDGSDELDCPGFHCSSGETVPEFWQCDGEDDCLDASDEAGCATFTCASTGDKLPAKWRCNQVHDCLDSSDEAGCAEVLCR
jgi:hypothetical protein